MKHCQSRDPRFNLSSIGMPILSVVGLALAFGCGSSSPQSDATDNGGSFEQPFGKNPPGKGLGGGPVSSGGTGGLAGSNSSVGWSGVSGGRRPSVGTTSLVGGAANGGSRAKGAGNGGTAAGRAGTIAEGGAEFQAGASSAGRSSSMGGAPQGVGGGSVDAGRGGTSGALSGGAVSPVLAPTEGALLGLYYGDQDIAATSQKLGRSLPLHLVYYAWEDDFSGGETLRDLNAGRIPFINWELFGANLDDIIAGKDDAMLAQRARALQQLKKPIFIDFGAEMNGDWSPWSGAENGKSADKFVAAYRHVHDALASADNIIWVWCPNVVDVPDATWNRAMNYYPGDTYVDWTCVDGYNWGTSSGEEWQSFRSVFQDIYSKLAAKGKPIMIGEMASTELGGDKAKWIDEMIPVLKSDFPMVKGILWFDVNKETDWRISSSPAAQSAFVRLASDPYFNPE